MRVACERGGDVLRISSWPLGSNCQGRPFGTYEMTRGGCEPFIMSKMRCYWSLE